jgi:hypothetical protein
MNLKDKLESVDCRTDDKARRVSNVAPDTVANVSAETLEKGVTLEALEALNVPVFCYQTQVTIHGKVADFNPSARPGGYKALMRNQNGSVGVRYGAIDAEKKQLLQRVARVTRNGWGVSINSTGCEVSRSYYVAEESERADKKAQAIADLKALPVARFYGSAFAGCLAYGAGYYVAAIIGAIPAHELWTLIHELWGVDCEQTLIDAEAKAQAEAEKKSAEAHAAYEAEMLKRQAEFDAQWQAMLPTLRKLTVAPNSGRVIIKKDGRIIDATLERERGRLFYTVKDSYKRGRSLAKDGFPWPKALANGNVYAPIN